MEGKISLIKASVILQFRIHVFHIQRYFAFLIPLSVVFWGGERGERRGVELSCLIEPFEFV